jgi:hypothetical protein
MTCASAAGATSRSTSSVSGEGPLRAAVHRMVAPGADAVFYELWLPRTYERVDVVVVADDATHGFELKSGRDTLGRLPRQVVAFSRVMDRCSLVVASRHLRVAATAVPDWWGLTVADEENQLEVVRPGRPNPGPFDRQTLVEMLWKRDVAAELARLGMISGRRTGWDSHTRDRMWVWLLEKVDVDELRACVRRALVLRAGERGPLTPSEIGAEADGIDGGGAPRRPPRASPLARGRALRVLARAEDGAGCAHLIWPHLGW